jgi:hypothetical protein
VERDRSTGGRLEMVPLFFLKLRIIACSDMVEENLKETSTRSYARDRKPDALAILQLAIILRRAMTMQMFRRKGQSHADLPQQ